METIVIAGSKEEIVAGLRALLNEEMAKIKPVTTSPAELSTIDAKKMMLAKGHRCTSNQGFRELMKKFGIEPVRRGVDNWWSKAELERMPSK